MRYAAAEIVDDGPEAIGIAGRDGDADLADEVVGGQAAGELLPGVAAVGGFVESAAGQVGRSVDGPWRTARGPERGVEDCGIFGVDGDVDGADVVGDRRRLKRTFFQVAAAVERAIEAAVGVGIVDVAEGGDVDAVRIVGVDGDAADVLGVVEADVGPGLALIGGLVHAVAVGVLAADVGLAGADVDDVGVRRGDGDGADGADGNAVCRRDGEPGAAGVFGLPDAAADGAEVEGVGLAGNAGDAVGAASAHGSDVAPVQAVEQSLRILARLSLGSSRKWKAKK